MSSMSTKTATSVKQQQQTTTTTTVVAKAAEPELMTMKEEEEKPANNSCVMLEEDEEEDIELGEESDEEDDEDIMYSDAESDEQEIEQDEDEVDESILDIDALDTEDPQLCADYVREIYKYMTHMERKYRIAPTFLEKKVCSTRPQSIHYSRPYIMSFLLDGHIANACGAYRLAHPSPHEVSTPTRDYVPHSLLYRLVFATYGRL